jgi:negative regulator of sigma E activity
LSSQSLARSEAIYQPYDTEFVINQSATPHRRRQSVQPHLVPVHRRAGLAKPVLFTKLVRSTLVATAICLVGHFAVSACIQLKQGLYLGQQTPVWQQYQSTVQQKNTWYRHELKQLHTANSLEQRAREQLDYANQGETLVAVQTY